MLDMKATFQKAKFVNFFLFVCASDCVYSISYNDREALRYSDHSDGERHGLLPYTLRYPWREGYNVLHTSRAVDRLKQWVECVIGDFLF
jgi:hypothetical protein